MKPHWHREDICLSFTFACRRTEIVVSTPTKVLQNQMIHGVAPILKEKFGVNFSKLLGTKNYISLEKFSRLLLANTEGKTSKFLR